MDPFLQIPNPVADHDPAVCLLLYGTACRRYATALTAATSAISSHAPTFIQRLSDSTIPSPSAARFLYAFILPTDTAIYVTFRGTDLTGYLAVYDKISALVDANSM
jgi:hypothetical protein